MVCMLMSRRQSQSNLPRRVHAQLIDLLNSREVPACKCWQSQPCECLEYERSGRCLCPRLPYPCGHIDAAARQTSLDEWERTLLECCAILGDFGFETPGYEDLEQVDRVRRIWGKLLHICWPGQYEDPAAPPSPALCLNQNARVALMAERYHYGFGLWHPKDLRTDLVQLANDGPLASRTINGRSKRQSLASREAKDRGWKPTWREAKQGEANGDDRSDRRGK